MNEKQCPNCGYCPTCGRKNVQFIPCIPWTAPNYPPYTVTWNSGDNKLITILTNTTDGRTQ